MAANRVVLLRAPVTGGVGIPRASQASQRSLTLATNSVFPVPAEDSSSLTGSRVQTLIEMLRKPNGSCDTRAVWVQEVFRMLSDVPVTSEQGTMAVAFVHSNMTNFVVAIMRDPLRDPLARLSPLSTTWAQIPVQRAALRSTLDLPLLKTETKKRKGCETATNKESPFKKMPSGFGNPRRYRGTGFKRTVLTSSPPATLDQAAWDNSNITDINETLLFAASPPGSSSASVFSDVFYWPPSDTTGTSDTAGYNQYHEMKGAFGDEDGKAMVSWMTSHIALMPGEFGKKQSWASNCYKEFSVSQKLVENEANIEERAQLEHNLSSRGDWFGADMMLSGQEEEEDPNDEDNGYWVWDRKVERFRHWDEQKQRMIYCPETFD